MQAHRKLPVSVVGRRANLYTIMQFVKNGPPSHERVEPTHTHAATKSATTWLKVSMNSSVIFLHYVVDFFKAACQLTPWVVYEGDSLFWAIREDYLRGTTRNTTEALIGLIGGFAGSFEGFAMGSAMGTAVCPGIGTVIGGLMGSLFLLVAGDYVCRQIASSVLDARGYNIGLYRCQKCNRRYLCRNYTGQSRTYCPNCNDDDGWQIRRF